MATTPTSNPIPSEDPRDLKFNAGKIDEEVNGSSDYYTDRFGVQRLTNTGRNNAFNTQLSEQQEEYADLVQNLIPLSRQYMTLEAAQADIANIPEGSTTYYRSPDDSALAIEVINNAGTLEPTGRKMPSYDSIKNLIPLNATTKFREMDDGEYAFGLSVDTATIDSENNVWYYTSNGKIYYLLDASFTSIETEELSVNGVSIDADSLLPADDRENLSALSDSTDFTLGGGEFEFNPRLLTIIDENKNILFDLSSYIDKSSKWDSAYDYTQNPPAQQVNPLLPFADTDGSGISQIYVINQEDGTQTQVTSGATNETNPRPEALDRIVWQSDVADAPPGKLFYARLPDFTPHAYIARKKIVGWGHSFINNGAFLRQLYNLTGVPTYNFGLAGQTSDAIASRQGGDPTYYMPVGGVIPASGSVNLTPAVPGPCRSLASAVTLDCNLAGVDGTFTWDGTNAIFTRSADGDEVSVSVLTKLYVYPITRVNVTGSIPAGTLYEDHDECINLFWLGRNNLSETDLIMQNLDGMVNYLKPLGQKFLILAEFNNSSETTGTTGFLNMQKINQRYQDKYPDYYCAVDGVDILQNFINHANPASEGDMEDVANGVTPRSLRYDSLHPSQQIEGTGGSLTPELALDYGANVNANFVYLTLKDKGYL